MSQNQKDKGNRDGNLSKEKSNGGFEKKNENSDGAPKKQQTPNEEVPNVGDQEKKGPSVVPTREPLKDEDQKESKEIGLGQIVSEGKAELEEEQPEEQEVK